MSEQLWGLLIVLPFAVAAGAAGGIAALFYEPSDRWRAAAQAFAAGVLTAIVAVDVLPEVRAEGDPLAVLAGFAVGGLLMVGINVLSARLERWSDNMPLGMAVAAALDTGIDGLIIGAGFATSDELGLLLVTALGLELAVLCFSVAAELRDAGSSRLQIVGASVGIAAMLAAGAVAGLLLLTGRPQGEIATVLAFAVAALLYLIVEELMAKAHAAGESPLRISAFFLGFLVLMAFTLLGPG